MKIFCNLNYFLFKTGVCNFSKNSSKDPSLSNLLKKLENKSRTKDFTKSLFAGLKIEETEEFFSKSLVKTEKSSLRKSSQWLSSLEKKKLGIFKDVAQMPADQAENSLFSRLEECERQKSIEVAPRNAFEEMLMWTKEGKVWNFPINNEQGMGAETAEPFHEHIFLHHNLSDLPSKGPLKQFLDLVLIGLSKNAFLSVAEKQKHIEWYKNYFQQNQLLCTETSSDHQS